MEISVNVSDVKLSDVVEQHYDENGEGGRPTTVLDLVVAEVVRQNRRELASLVHEVRTDLVREALAPIVAEAIAAPVQKTNTYGEPVGGPTTLRDLVLTRVRDVLAEPVDKYNRAKGTLLDVMIRKEVEAAFRREVAGELAEARAGVRKRVVEIAAEELSKLETVRR